MMSPPSGAFSQQQQSHGQYVVYDQDGISVRTMTAADKEFVGHMMVEGFRGKVVHAVGEQKMPIMKEISPQFYSPEDDKFNRTFVAEFKGERSGAMELKFQENSRYPDGGGGDDDVRRRLGFWSSVRLSLMVMAFSEKVESGKCLLEGLCVDSKFRGQGVGKALLDVADQQARNRKCQSIYLWVASDNRARNLYAREGYQKISSSSLCGFMKCITGIKTFYKMEKTL